jgi:hypothetical protein
MTQEERTGWNRFKYFRLPPVRSAHPEERQRLEPSLTARTRRSASLTCQLAQMIFRVFSRVSRAQFLRQSGDTYGPRAGCHVWLRLCRAADSYGAVSIIKRCCPAETGENSLHNTEWILPARVAQTCISIFIDSTIATG